METNRKMHWHLSLLFGALVLTLMVSVALPTNAQTSQAQQQERPIPTPVQPVGTPPPPRSPNNDITQQELANMNNFLDNHPEIAEQLRKDPSLIDNKRFVDSHPELQQFLQTHGEIKEEFMENPGLFMHDEKRYEGATYRRDLSPQVLANMDHFMDSHREIAEQLRKDPSLADNQRFLADHPELQQFLDTHPDIRNEIRNNPDGFMRAEDRYEHAEDARNGYDRDHDRDWNRREIAGFGDFLRGHSNCAEALSRNPSLANNREFLADNPELRDYLKGHPAVQQQLAANPQAVLTSPALAAPANTMPHKATTMPSPKPEGDLKPHN